MACCAWNLLGFSIPCVLSQTQAMSTHVPCFPVKPWKSTFVSPLMRRFLMVSAYCEEPVAYCLVADLESAVRRGCRRACIVALGGLSRRQSCVDRGESRIASLVELLGFERARSCDTWAAFPRLQHPRQANLDSRPRPTIPR
jgi:hypothetical protein